MLAAPHGEVASAAFAAVAPAAAEDPFGHEGQAEGYAALRPTYPPALLEHLWRRPVADSGGRGLAVDACCGTGQLTTALAEHFACVVGIDQSEAQLRQASRSAGNVEYCRGDAAALEGTEASSADLVTIAQGLHWLDIPAFCTAAERALRPGGYLAVLGYGRCSLAAGGACQEAFERYYHDTLGSHLPRGQAGNWWGCDRVLVDTGFGEVVFPFPEVTRHWHVEKRRLPLEDFIGYLRTWSAYRAYVAANSGAEDPLESLRGHLESALGVGCDLEVDFPFYIILARTKE